MAYKKCVICGESITDGQGVPYKGRFAHPNCFNIAIKTLQTDKAERLIQKEKPEKTKTKKANAELKMSLTEEEYQDKKQYYSYIKDLIQEDQLSAKVYVLTDEYIKKYGFTFKGLYLTLVYLKEILEKELTGDVVGILPYYYEEAKQYYTTIEKISAENKDVSFSNMYKEKIIKINPKHKRIMQIDITSIDEK